MLIVNSIDALLEHIKDVQSDIIKLSNESLLKMSSFVEKNNLEIDDDISLSLQYQDIITQQLNATIEAIDSMRDSMEIFNYAFKSDENLVNESMKKLEIKLTQILKEAKEKKDRFSGNIIDTAQESDAIEFF